MATETVTQQRLPDNPWIIRDGAPIGLTGGVHQTPPEYSPYGGRQGYAPALPDMDYQQREITVSPTAPVERDWGEINGW